MVVHMQAWFESLDQTLGNVAPLLTTDGEQLLRTSGDNTQVLSPINKIFGAYVGAPTAEIARFVSPTLDTKARPYLNPLSTTVEPASPPAWVDLREVPIEFGVGEDMQLQVENDGAGSAEDVYGLAWWGDTVPQRVPGAWMTVRALTAASAMVAGDWNRRSITLDNALKPGDYEIGGLLGISGGSVAVRTVPRDSVYRPGVLGADTVVELGREPWRYGRFGSMGTFDSTRPIDLEFLENTTTNAVQEVFLDVRKIR